MKLVEVKTAKEFASTFFVDPVLKMAVNAVLDNAPGFYLVRCKDCIHWYEPEETCLKIYSDGNVSPHAWQFRKPNDFCSYGERKYND